MGIDKLIFIKNIPFYFLVMTYTSIQFLLQVTKNFFSITCVSFSLLLVSLNPAVLLWYHMCLPDIQQGQSELLQLTAGYTH
jgi:hypothetical protein